MNLAPPALARYHASFLGMSSRRICGMGIFQQPAVPCLKNSVRIEGELKCLCSKSEGRGERIKKREDDFNHPRVLYDAF